MARTDALGKTVVLGPRPDVDRAGEREVLESEAISSDDNPDALLSALSETAEVATATITSAGRPAQVDIYNTGSPHDRSGQVINDRYRLLRMLGKGGMGTVYIAQHTALAKTFAVKLLNPRYAARTDIAERFLQEAKAVSMIEHDNVVGVTDFGTATDGSAFLVMEHLRGESLAALAKREAPLEWLRVRHIMIQVCRALQAAHDVGVVHRDVKPDNILRTERGDDKDFVKVLDFGLAKLQTGGGLRLTKTGMVLGTPEYMSPEQARGGTTDHRTDIYAAGIVMYVLLCGRPPFRSKNFVGMRNQHLLVAPDPPSKHAPEAGISNEMDAVVLRALAKEPGNRFESMAAMREAIEAVGTGAGPVQLFEAGGTYEDEDPPTLEVMGGLVERNSMLGDRGQVVSRRGGRLRGRAPVSATAPAVVTDDDDASDRSRSRSILGISVIAVIAGVAAAIAYAGYQKREPTPAAPVEAKPEPEPPAPTPEPIVAAPTPATTAVISFRTNVPVRVLEAVDESLFGEGEPLEQIEVPRSDAELKLILRADGYLDAQVSVTPDHDQAVVIVLEPAPEPVSEPEPTNRKPAKPEPKPAPEPQPEPPVVNDPDPPPTDNSFAPGIVDPWKKRG